MSRAEVETSESSDAGASARTWKTMGVVLLCALLIAFLVLEGMSLLAAQQTERQRREVGMAGGLCEFERRSPHWLKTLAGDDVLSFFHYPVIVGVTMTGAKIGDDNLARLPNLPEMERLDLHDSQVTSDGLEVISRWNAIRTLNLANTPVTDITSLADLPRLESLKLNFSQVRREHLAGLSQLENLTALGAGYIQVTDQDVLEIARCSKLQELSIAGADLGEQGLQPLTSLQQLNRLVLTDAQLNPADLEAFKTARPDVTVAR